MKLAGMTASVAGRYASDKVHSVFASQEKVVLRKKDSYTKMAGDIADTLGELKGAVMKIGQIASQTQDFLPKEFSDALQKLQKDAPPVEFETIKNQVETQLKGEIATLYKSFDIEPYASASIGQVHRAVLHDGTEVVVKVQYPGVEESCDSDLKQLKLTLKLGGLLKMPKSSVDALFLEIKERLHEELDYVNEAKNLVNFREFHKDQPKIIVPKVVDELSTRKVLTLVFEDGDHAAELESAGYEQDVIDDIGHGLFDMLARQLFVFNQIHGDPHPGNFAFRKDGSVVIYDFGCVKMLKPEIVEAYRDAINSSLKEDYQSLDSAMLKLGARVRSKPTPGKEYYAVWRDIFFEPFLSSDKYDFGKADLHTKAAKQTPLFFKHIEYFKPPVDSLYIDRMIGGQYWIMKNLGVKADFSPMLSEFL